MTIHLATDHAGFEHKEVVSAWLKSEGYEILDHGALVFDSEDDFPDFISKAARAVSVGGGLDRAIIFGGSGQGEAIVANRFPGVRAVVFYGGEELIPILSRQHNDSNVISIGARFTSVNTTKKVIWDWLHTEAFPAEKYKRRNEKIEIITRNVHL